MKRRKPKIKGMRTKSKVLGDNTKPIGRRRKRKRTGGHNTPPAPVDSI